MRGIGAHFLLACLIFSHVNTRPSPLQRFSTHLLSYSSIWTEFDRLPVGRKSDQKWNILYKLGRTRSGNEKINKNEGTTMAKRRPEKIPEYTHVKCSVHSLGVAKLNDPISSPCFSLSRLRD